MIENYLQILEESLQKKLKVLKLIEEENGKQEAVLREDTVSMDAFEETVNTKEHLIEELNRLDQGFEQLYDRIKEQLIQNKAQYKVQISNLQQLIARITDSSVSVQTQEARNKKLVEKFFGKAREDMRTGRQNSKAAYDYYRSLNSSAVVEPRFMDQKK